MKTITKTSLAFVLLAALNTSISCTRESVKSPATQSVAQSPSQTASDNVQALHYIGESYGGGIIFYLDSTKEHGLIAAPYDQSTGIAWYNNSYFNTGARSAPIGSGAKNTNKIVNAQGAGSYAAKLCKALVLNGYSDWFLPSKQELYELYKHESKVPGLDTNALYWSSTESDANTAWEEDVDFGNKIADDKARLNHVRAVRSF